jgi:hypothetical protein
LIWNKEEQISTGIQEDLVEEEEERTGEINKKKNIYKKLKRN